MRLRVQGAIAEVAELQFWLTQLDFAAVGQGDAVRLPVQADSAFRCVAGDGHVLQLAAVGWFGDHTVALQLGLLACGSAGIDRRSSIDTALAALAAGGYL